jgi:hypothetical protein
MSIRIRRDPNRPAAVPMELVRDQSVSHLAVRVYCLVPDEMSAEPVFVDEWAKMLGESTDSVYAAVAELANGGYLT